MKMHRLLLVVALAAAGCFSADPTVGNCKANADCAEGSTCNQDLHVCEFACPTVCQAQQLCVSGQCVDALTSIGAVTVTDNSQAGSNGFYPRAAGIDIPVTVQLRAKPNATVSSANLVVGDAQVTGTNNAGTDTWAFSVPATVQTPGSEAPVRFTVAGANSDGTSYSAAEPAAAPGLKIDDAPPHVAAIAAAGGATGTDGNRWFKVDGAAKADIRATIADDGSGVDASTLQLENAATGTRIDDGSPTLAGGTATFHVPQNLIPAGTESLIGLRVAATDNLAHARAASGTDGSFGLDGKPPGIAFTPPYPADRTGCSPTDTANVFCGHDGHHFTRKDTATLSFTVTDGGSGVDPASGTCAINGVTASCTSASGAFSFPVDFSTVNVTTDSKGNATIPLTLGAKDLTGNTTSDTSKTVDMTRVKWVRTVLPLNSLAGAPILSPQLGALIVAGNNGGGDPIVAIDTSSSNGGGLLWSAGHSLTPVILKVTNNMALDTTPSSDADRPSPVLYVNTANAIYALHLTTSGVDKYCFTGSPGGALIGSPVIFSGGATARAVFAAGTQLTGIAPTNMAASGGGCGATALFSFGAATNPKVGAPSANGQTVYVGYDNSLNVANDRGIGFVTFNGSNLFSNPQQLNLGFQPAAPDNSTPAAITPASDLFFENVKNFQFSRYNNLLTFQWNSAATINSISSSPVVSGAFVFGAADGLKVFNIGDGALAWSALDGAVQVSPPAIGNGIIYASSQSDTQLHAIDSSTHSDKWAYHGNGSTAITGPTTELTVAADGTVYFGEAGGNIYALISDTAPAATGAGDWPRTGFDNCNSNHANNPGYTCQ